MAFLFFGSNRNVSAKKLKKWLDDGRLDKVVEVLTTGSKKTVIHAIETLREINMANVKRELITLAAHKDADISKKAMEVLEQMGLTTEERNGLGTSSSE